MPARPARQPVADLVVDDEMHVEIARHTRLDLFEEFVAFGGAMAREALANHAAGGDVEAGEERSRAVAGVVVAAPRRLAGAHRQHQLAAVERLDLRLLVDAQNNGLGRRRKGRGQPHRGPSPRSAGRWRA